MIHFLSASEQLRILPVLQQTQHAHAPTPSPIFPCSMIRSEALSCFPQALHAVSASKIPSLSDHCVNLHCLPPFAKLQNPCPGEVPEPITARTKIFRSPKGNYAAFEPIQSWLTGVCNKDIFTALYTGN